MYNSKCLLLTNKIRNLYVIKTEPICSAVRLSAVLSVRKGWAARAWRGVCDPIQYLAHNRQTHTLRMCGKRGLSYSSLCGEWSSEEEGCSPHRNIRFNTLYWYYSVKLTSRLRDDSHNIQHAINIIWLRP